MKMDKLKFARLIGYITREVGSMNDYVVEELDHLIDVDIPQVSPTKVNPQEVDCLMALMAEGTRKIETIKAYRNLTGQGLKESKDAIEKYWVSKDHAWAKTIDGY